MEMMDMEEKLISSQKRNILERHWKLLYTAVGILAGCLLTIGITYVFFSLGKDKVQINVQPNAEALNGSQQQTQKGRKQQTISKDDLEPHGIHSCDHISKDDFENLSKLLKTETDKSKNELKSFLQEYLQTLLTTRERNTQQTLLQTLGNYSQQELISIKKSKDDITILLQEIKNGNFSYIRNILQTESVNSRDDIKRMLKESMRNETLMRVQDKKFQLTFLQHLRNDSQTEIKLITDSKNEIIQLLGDVKNKSQQDFGNLEKLLKTEVTKKNLYQELQHMQEKIDDLMKVLEDTNYTSSNRSHEPTVEKMMDCVDWQQKGFTENGVYNITPNGTTTAIQVYCDMTTDGGGWLVFQRRINGTTNFDRKWTDYENGFGNVAQEYWLGNKYLHDLTSSPTDLRIDVEDWSGIKRYAKYSTFVIGDATSKYTLYVEGYSGNAGDSLAFHHIVKFSTKDQDNEKNQGGCATSLQGAWWFEYCGHSSLNGMYIKGGAAGHNKGINWQKWKGDNYSMKRASMMLRRR